MWNESNFLFKGFINEVRGVLTESGSSSGGGSMVGISASGRIPKYDIGIAENTTPLVKNIKINAE